MEGEKSLYPDPPSDSAGKCQKYWYVLLPYFKLKSLTSMIWCLFTFYTLILSISQISSSKSSICVQYQFGASYTPAVKYKLHFHRWILPFFMHRSLFQNPSHWFTSSIVYFLAGYEVEYFIGPLNYLVFQIFIQFGADLLSQTASPNVISYGSFGVTIGLFTFQAMRLILKLQKIKSPYGCRLVFFLFISFLHIILVKTTTDLAGHIGIFTINLGGVLVGIFLSPSLFYIPWRSRMELHSQRNKKLSLILVGIGIGILLMLLMSIFFIIPVPNSYPCP